MLESAEFSVVMPEVRAELASGTHSTPPCRFFRGFPEFRYHREIRDPVRTEHLIRARTQQNRLPLQRDRPDALLLFALPFKSKI